MSYKINIQPSGHNFFVEARASVLKAGLREGINLDHNCANGACGACKAKLVAGELETIRGHDFRLTDQEKSDGYFLMCCHRPISDLVLQAHESDKAADIPQQQIEAKVSKVEVLQEDVILLTIRAPRSKALHFLAGQSVALTFEGLTAKMLAIASCPCDGLQLRFHVRRRDDPFSTYVFESLKKNQKLTLDGPIGDFTLNEESKRPLILVAWESGFAQIASLIDHVIQKNESLEIHLYWLSGIPDGHYLSNYCRSWRDALDNFHYHSIDLVPSGDVTYQQFVEQLAARHQSLNDWDMYLALPEHEAINLPQAFVERGMLQQQICLSVMEHA